MGHKGPPPSNKRSIPNEENINPHFGLGNVNCWDSLICYSGGTWTPAPVFIGISFLFDLMDSLVVYPTIKEKSPSLWGFLCVPIFLRIDAHLELYRQGPNGPLKTDACAPSPPLVH